MFNGNKEKNVDIDLTRTAYPVALGARHPISIVKEEICDICEKVKVTFCCNENKTPQGNNDSAD